MNGSDAKLGARELLEEAHPALVGLSHWIHANPEVGFQETLASGWVSEWLATAGFEVETQVADMPTAVIGRTGPGPFHVAICVEYDALPEVGHACGHNVIAAAGVGAGLALASVADQLGLRITVMGTPAEETGGGKLRLLEAGAFDGVHAAMMVHPWPSDVATPRIIAVNQLEITYTGREAHAAGFPQRGLNAGDALVVAQTAIGLLRQQLLPTDRVHGIVTRGGDAPNIIPAHTTALYMVRAHDRARMDELTGLVTRCFEAGALATGTEVSVVEGTAYLNMVHDPDLAALYRHNAELLGREFDDSDGAPVSTDMGNVSHVVPSIHPMIGIDTNGAVNHQQAFTDACATPSADQAILDGAIAMTWTVIDAVQDEVLRARLIGDALAREALELVEQADELEQQAGVLADAAETLATVDPETAGELALASVLLDSEAQDLSDAAEQRLGAAVALQDEALLDEAAGELASDADDLAYQAGVLAESSDEQATQATEDLAAATALEQEAAELEAESVAAIDPEQAAALTAAAVLLEDQAGDLREEADIRAADAADLVGSAVFVMAAADQMADEADVMAGVEPASIEGPGGEATGLADEATALSDEATALSDEEAVLSDSAGAFAKAAVMDAEESLELAGDAAALSDEAEGLAVGAWAFADASDAAFDAVVDDATVALRATEEAADVGSVADALATEAADLAGQSSELAAEAEAFAREAVAVAAADPDQAELLADNAFQFETQAEVTASEAQATFEEAIEAEAEARAADDLAEVAIEAAEDAQDDAVVDAVLAESLADEAIETDALAEVVAEAADDAALQAVADAVVADALAEDAAPADASMSALGPQHSDWEQQFQTISAHVQWDAEYARMAGGDEPSSVTADASLEPSVDHVDDGTSVVDDASAPVSPPDDREDVGATNEEILASAMAWLPDADALGPKPQAADDGWYSGAPELLSTPDAGGPEESGPETPPGDFEWIPAKPDTEG